MSGLIFLEAAEISVSENDGVVRIIIVREGDDSQPVTVSFETVPGTAGASDFQGFSGTVTIPAGQDRVAVEIPITDDNLSEATEFFSISLSNVSSGALQFPRTSTVSILDDENPVTDPPQPPLESDFDVSPEAVFTGISQPIAFEFLPDDPSRMYVAQKNGLITLRDIDTGQIVSTVLDLSDEVNNRQDRGLLDIAIHPDFANNPYIYAFYTVDPPEAAGLSGNAGRDGGGNRFSWLVRWEVNEDGTGVIADSKTIMLGAAGQTYSDVSGGGAVDSTSNITIRSSERDPDTGEIIQDYLKADSRSHIGGSIEFGPDGALYVSTGDGTSFGRVDPRTVDVQDINSLTGKILRIDPITGEGLSDNPFYTGDAGENASKVYQLGLRNPFSMSFDVEGQLIITDTGWNNWEEINVGGAGANFGWPFYEGGDNGQNLRTSGYQNLPEAAAFYAGDYEGVLTAAFRGFAHNSNTPGFQLNAITGSDDVIRSELYPNELQNHYIFTDVTQSEIYAVNVNDRRDVKFLYKADGPRAPVHFKQGPDGKIYFADIATGEIGTLSISGGTQITTIDGTSGNDFLLGSPGDDLMLGNGGSDKFEGSLGDDEIVGNTAAYDQVDYAGGRDDYIFVENPDGTVTATGALTGTDTLRSIEGVWFNGAFEWVSIATLVAEDQTGPIVGTNGRDTLRGTDGADVMIGRGGLDTFVYSPGDDQIFGFEQSGPDDGTYDQVDYAGSRDDYVFVENPDGTVTVTGALTGVDTLTGIEGVWFFGAGEWVSIATLVEEDRSNLVIGTAGSDRLFGTSGDDTMIGNGGSDFFETSRGDDIIIGNEGSYDQVDYAGGPSDFSFVRNADGTVSVTGASTGTDTLTSIEGFWFNGARVWRSLTSLLSSTETSSAQSDSSLGIAESVDPDGPSPSLLARVTETTNSAGAFVVEAVTSLFARRETVESPDPVELALDADAFEFSGLDADPPQSPPSDAASNGIFSKIMGSLSAAWTQLTELFSRESVETGVSDQNSVDLDEFAFDGLDLIVPALSDETDVVELIATGDGELGSVLPEDGANDPLPAHESLPPRPDWVEDGNADWMG